jgi:cell division protein FtsI (penicillin-binding protein 3)
VENRQGILKRTYGLYIFLGLFGLVILGRVFQISFINGAYWRSKAENLTISYRTIEAVRGNIYALDGSLLATSVPIYEVRFDPNAEAITDDLFNTRVDTLAECLHNLFKDKSTLEYKRELVAARDNGERYHLIKRNVKYTQLKAMRDFPIFSRGRYKGGFIFVQQNKRQKPFNVLASRTIGYERDGSKVGLEGAYSDALRGVSGKRLMKKIAGGVWMPVSDENEVEPEDGSDLVSTIDVNIQDVAESALHKQLRKHDAEHGCVILMEVATGEIRAIANLQRGEDGRYYESYNFAVGASTEPGSTFKLASYMVAMEHGFIDLDYKVETGNGSFEFYDKTMYDSKEGGYGTITVKEAFAVSSNIGIARIIDKFYKADPQKFIDELYAMRLNEPLGLEIPGEGKPVIKSANDESWSGISLPWISHGYEVAMTPMQILTFYNAVANNGKMVKPMLVKSVREHGRDVQVFEPVVLNERIASEETIAKAREMLEEVVRSGTAVNLKDASYAIAGKTGTAQIAKGRTGYDKSSHQASFCGYFPAEDPKYTCMVVVNAPNRNVYYGNLVAGPIFKEIADKVYSTSIDFHEELQPQLAENTINIPVSKSGHAGDLKQVFAEVSVRHTPVAETDWVVTQTGIDSVTMKPVTMREGLIPNVKGMAPEDAIYLLENLGLSVRVLGKGLVKNQSVAPGTRVSDVGSTIKLQLS